MKNRIIIATTITLTVFSQIVTAVDITDTYLSGDTLTATKMDNIKAAVNSKLDDAANSVTASHIATGAVGASEIATNAVTSGDTLNEAGLEFLQRFGIGIITNVPVTWTSIATLTVSAPSNGYVNCVGTGSVDVDDATSTDFVYVGWDINNSTVGVAPDSYIAINQTAGSNDFTPYASMHTYSVSAGISTFSFKVETAGIDATDFDIYQNSYACMFFPTRY